MRIAVVGAGIAGLAAAWELVGRGCEVTVFEPGHVGGKIRTSQLAGLAVDEGPDSFLMRAPEAAQLCREVGLDQLVAPAAGRTQLWARGRLRDLPAGLVLGVPGRLGPIIRSGLVSPLGLARAALDLVLPAGTTAQDVSVGDLVGRRFGSEVAATLVEPLLGGIHAASLDELSAELTAPQILAVARESRSLLLGLQRVPAPTASGPVFSTPLGGTGRLIEALERALRERSVAFVPEAVAEVRPVDCSVTLTGGFGPSSFDGAVLAVPAAAAAGMLGPAAPKGLSEIPFSSVAILSVVVDERDGWRPPPGYSGFLVPRADGRLMTACSFYTNKWTGPAADGRHVLRLSAGHTRDRRVDQWSDDELEARLLSEVREAVGHSVVAVETRLSRWPAALPLYRVGHGRLVDEIEGELASSAPGVALAGASYRGAGLPACIRTGRAAAAAVSSPR